MYKIGIVKMSCVLKYMILIVLFASCSRSKGSAHNKALVNIPMSLVGDINVLDYGADPDGLRSSQAAFEKAIEMAISQSNILYIPSGNYLLERTLFISSTISIKGAGVLNTGLKFVSNKPDQWIFIFGKGSMHSSISGLSISNANGNGIQHIESIRSKIEDVKAGFGLLGTAFQAVNSIMVKYVDVEVGTNGLNFFRGMKSKPKHGIVLLSGIKYNSNQAVLERCYIAGCSSDGILIDGREHNDGYSLFAVINNSISEGNQGYGIHILGAQGVRVVGSHLEANQRGDLLLKEAHGFQWTGGIIGRCQIQGTAGSVFMSPIISTLDIDSESYNCTFIGGVVQLSNNALDKKGKWNDNTFIGVIRNNYGANGKGQVIMANQNLWGEIITKNGSFEKWDHNYKNPKYFSSEGSSKISRSKEAFLGEYSVKLVSSGRDQFEGISFSLEEYESELLSNVENHRVSVSVWVKYNDVTEDNRMPVILGSYGQYYNQWAKQHRVKTRRSVGGDKEIAGEWHQLTYSFVYRKGINVLISFPENTKPGCVMFVDALTIAIGNSVPSIYAQSTFDVVNKEREILYRTEVPSQGSFTKGDLVYNMNPASLGYVGWICIESGIPGVWRSFGKID